MADKAFSQIIYDATAGQHAVMSVSEAAKIMSVSEATVYDYRHDRTEPSYKKIKDFNDELIKRGYFHLSMQFIPCGGEGNANGTLDDEAARMIQLIGKLYDAESKTEFRNITAEMEQVLRDFKAEGELL